MPLVLGRNLLARMSSSSSKYVGPVQTFISQQIEEKLAPAQYEVRNESHRRLEDESHFHVLVVSDAFKGQSRIQRHRSVQSLFTDDANELKFHSLRITARTPEEQEKKQSVPKAPGCTGKGDGRGPTNIEKL